MLLPNDTQQFAFILISQFTLIERITYHPVALLSCILAKKMKVWVIIMHYGEPLASHQDIVWSCLYFGSSN